MKKEFKVGDKVWCKEYGHGVVFSEFNNINSAKYPIKIKFKGELIYQYYTKEGAYVFDGEIELFHRRDVFPNWFKRIINKLRKKS